VGSEVRRSNSVCAPFTSTVMRRAGVAALASVCVALSACATTGPYDSAAEAIRSAGYGWGHLDDHYSPGPFRDFPEEVSSAGEAAFQSCIASLSADWRSSVAEAGKKGLRQRTPNKDERMLRLVACMAEKRWGLVGFDVVVTS